MESDDHTSATEARLRRQILLGHVPALARQANGDHLALDALAARARGFWATALAGLVDMGYVKATGHSVIISLRPP
jgi:hypothetical protein